MGGISVAPRRGATSSVSRDPPRRGSQGKKPAAVGQKGTTPTHARMLHRAPNMFFFYAHDCFVFSTLARNFPFFSAKIKKAKTPYKKPLRKIAETCGKISQLEGCFSGFNVFFRRKYPKSFEKKGRKFQKLLPP